MGTCNRAARLRLDQCTGCSLEDKTVGKKRMMEQSVITGIFHTGKSDGRGLWIVFCPATSTQWGDPQNLEGGAAHSRGAEDIVPPRKHQCR